MRTTRACRRCSWEILSDEGVPTAVGGVVRAEVGAGAGALGMRPPTPLLSRCTDYSRSHVFDVLMAMGRCCALVCFRERDRVRDTEVGMGLNVPATLSSKSPSLCPWFQRWSGICT